MPTITRLTMRAATRRARQWDAEAAEEGDSAAPKKQLVFEVSKRALAMELAAACGDSAAQILWDIEHFYDAVDIEGLAEDVECYNFPREVAGLAMQAHAGTRRLKLEGCFSKEIASTARGILAGCSSSTSLARLTMLGPLRFAQTKGVTAAVHVDDVSQTTIASTATEVKTKSCQAGKDFIDRVASKGLTIAKKSTVVATSVQLARQIAKEFAKAGVTLQVQAATVDLGVGTKPGRRTSSTIRLRLQAGLSRASRISALRSQAARATKLFQTGCFAACSFGHQVGGMSPTQRDQLDRCARKCAGSFGLRPCPRTSTALSIRGLAKYEGAGAANRHVVFAMGNGVARSKGSDP